MAQPDKASQRPFRVIIVGAGVVGLSLSQALQLANIDHVVLEKHSKIVSLHGAALMIYPGVARVFDQMGILKKIQDSMTPISREYQRWPDGSVLMHGKSLINMAEVFDMPVILFDRQKCVTHLYDGLPDQSKVRTSARVQRLEQDGQGVKVWLTDGTCEEGDMVVGADGVHSLVRELMWDYADKNDPKLIPESDRKALFAQYKGLFGVSNQGDLPDLGPADVNIIGGQDVTKLLFTQPGIAYWALIYKDEYSQPPKSWKPSEEEVEEVAQRFKDIKFGESLAFHGLWKNKTRSGLVNIEEGILDKWHAGRIVLVGDSAHKMTADIGVGANMAVESAVVLANTLQSFLSKNSTTYHPSNSELTSLFQTYQDKRYERAKIFMTLSGGVTRMRSYQSLWKKFFVTRIATLPFMQKMQGEKMMAGFAKGPKLEYVETRTINEDADGWKLANEEGNGNGWLAYAVLTSAVGVGLSYMAVLKWGLPSL
ncbi:FAD/NAD(P)-binding domain-containing protein [Setomelanomma holmii]|uniref:FAD/NAD(P)-binding domain-containing protein n=1 Tax=Setomelanomma holmii TaxID=210430 RepID=A0A9P4HBR4_9PLEO|nr:FAD/NAD(P)-binding domain-containing protein [Setomelanomma holmii]